MKYSSEEVTYCSSYFCFFLNLFIDKEMLSIYFYMHLTLKTSDQLELTSINYLNLKRVIFHNIHKSN